MSKEIQIPETGLRQLYNTLKVKNTEEQKEVAKYYYDNTDELIELYNESIKSFGRYNDPKENFFNRKYKRKEIRKPQEEKGTRKVIAYFKESNNKISITNESSLNFDYINREISTYRSTNSGNKSSGLGGIDFIGWNTSKKGPIIGEIKVKSDGNPFVALIQTLTYSSEMFTQNQIERINKFRLFGDNNIIDFGNKNIYIYLLFFGFPGKGERKSKKNELLEYALYIAGNIKNKIKDIKDISFLFMEEKKDSSNGYEISCIKDFKDFEKLKKYDSVN